MTSVQRKIEVPAPSELKDTKGEATGTFPIEREAEHLPQPPRSPSDDDRMGYRLVASGPPVDPQEVETTEPVVEVLIMWGETSVLHAAYLSPPRAFCVGDETDEKGKPVTDFLMDSETIGVDRLPVVTPCGKSVAVVIPADASGEVIEDGHSSTVDELLAQGRLQPCVELAGAWQYPLVTGAIAHIFYRGFTFVVRPGLAGKRIGIHGESRIDWKSYRWTFISAALMILILSLLYLLPPTGIVLSLERLDDNSRLIKFSNVPGEK